jgi:hypothetical protein
MPEIADRRVTANPRSHIAQWVIAVILAFIAGMLWTRPWGGAAHTALGQSAPLVGARGVYAFTGQLDRNRYGLFMLDIEQGTVWCYEIDNVGGVCKLRLTAARSWVYDRYLRDFNCAGLDLRSVQQLVAQQRATPPPPTPDDIAELERGSQAAPAEGDSEQP